MARDVEHHKPRAELVALAQLTCDLHGFQRNSACTRLAATGLPAPTAAASPAPHQAGTPDVSHTLFEPPTWSPWACVITCVATGRTPSALMIPPACILKPASTSTSPTR
jgi:hypothetical protein